jgi:hypothetical protein
LVLQGYTPKQLEYKTGGPSLLSHLYTEEMLRAAFAVTEILEVRAYDADLTEDTRHRGRSALIGMVRAESTPFDDANTGQPRICETQARSLGTLQGQYQPRRGKSPA